MTTINPGLRAGRLFKGIQGQHLFKKQYFVLFITVLAEYTGNKSPCKHI